MVTLRYLLSVTAVIISAAPGIFATSLVEAAAAPDIVVYDPAAPAVVKRDDIAGRVDVSKRHGPSKVDPYHGWTCSPRLHLNHLPSHPTCNQNNCYRAFLNARKGSKGFHCPSVAYDYCCQWYSLNKIEKEAVVKNGILYHYLPWTENCGAAGPFHSPAEIKNVVAKIDDVCACTIKHLVRVTLPNDYAALTPLGVRNPICVQHL